MMCKSCPTIAQNVIQPLSLVLDILDPCCAFLRTFLPILRGFLTLDPNVARYVPLQPCKWLAIAANPIKNNWTYVSTIHSQLTLLRAPVSVLNTLNNCSSRCPIFFHLFSTIVYTALSVENHRTVLQLDSLFVKVLEDTEKIPARI